MIVFDFNRLWKICVIRENHLFTRPNSFKGHKDFFFLKNEEEQKIDGKEEKISRSHARHPVLFEFVPKIYVHFIRKYVSKSILLID